MPDPKLSSSREVEFTQNWTEGEMDKRNETTCGLIQTLRIIGNKIGEDLREAISHLLSPDMIFNTDTTPYPFL